ncbi:putative reverse transcriptase domain-containing protein [Tanacetum coccineum]
MPPKSRPLTQAAIERMITQRVNEALTDDRARRVNVGNNASRAGGSGQGRTPAARECTFTRFMNCNLTVFHGIEGAIELRRWFEKTEMVFGISECAEGKKVKLAATTLQGPALTWWNTKVATMGLGTVNQIPWIEMKQMMTTEFCPAEEVQRMEHKLWSLKVKEYNIAAYTQRGLSENIKIKVTSSRPTNLNEAENFQSGNSSRGNYKDNSRHRQNNQNQGNTRAMTTAPNEGRAQVEGHTRNHYPKKNKPQGGNASGRAYVIKDADKQGPNVIMAEHDAIIICGEKDVRIPCENKTLIVKGDKVTEKKSKEKCLEDVLVIRD